jgi:glyoxylase-like metal-dependent hydrolase (beta-lactamase superfamily II)
MLLRALTGLLLALPLSAQAGLPEEGTRPAPKVLGVDVTYLANEGFFLESGRYSVLIDAFVRERVGVFAALPTELHREMANAKPPFDELTLVLVSHDHPDHVQWRGIERFLGKNAQAQLITAAPIVMGFEAGAQDYAAVEKRVTTVPVKRGSESRTRTSWPRRRPPGASRTASRCSGAAISSTRRSACSRAASRSRGTGR